MDRIFYYAFADESSPMVDGQIDALKRNGLDGIEIRNVDDVNVADITLDKAREVKVKFDNNGLKIWSIGSPIGKIDIEKDDFKAHLEKLKHTIEIANILGAENMRMFSFYIPEGKDPAIFKNEVIDRLSVMEEIARGTGVTLCHENEKGIYGDTTERCLDIYTAIPNIKGVFDPANMVQCKEDTKEAFVRPSKYLKYIHIKDALEDGNVVPAGEGAGNIRHIIEQYIKMGGRHITLEPHLAVFSGLAGLEKKGEEIQVGKTKSFGSNEEAFDAGCAALRKVTEGL